MCRCKAPYVCVLYIPPLVCTPSHCVSLSTCVFDGCKSHSRLAMSTKGEGKLERGKTSALVLRVNRAVVHTVPLTSCEACSQWEMNLQRMSPSDIQETLHWSLLHCSRHAIVVISTVRLMALIYLNAWKTFTFRLQRIEKASGCGGVKMCGCVKHCFIVEESIAGGFWVARLYLSHSLRKSHTLPRLAH